MKIKTNNHKIKLTKSQFDITRYLDKHDNINVTNSWLRPYKEQPFYWDCCIYDERGKLRWFIESTGSDREYLYDDEGKFINSVQSEHKFNYSIINDIYNIRKNELI